MTLGQLLDKMWVGGPVGLFHENTFYGGAYENPAILYDEWGDVEGIIEECDPDLLGYEVLGIDSATHPDDADASMLVIGLEGWEGDAR